MIVELVKNREKLEDFVLKFICNSYEGQVVGLDFDSLMKTILSGENICDEIAKDNILISKVSGHNEIFLEELNGELTIKDGLSEEQLIDAQEQLLCYEKEKKLVSVLKHKIKLTQELIEYNYFI